MSRPFIPVLNNASVELIYTMTGEVYENVLHVSKASPYSLADLQAVRTIVDNWDNTTGKALRSAGAYLTRIRTKALDSLGSPYEDYAFTTPRNGTRAGGNILPNGMAFCMKLSTGLTGRSFRGRIYVGGLNYDQLTSSVDLSASAVTGLLTGYGTLMTNLAAGGHTLAVVSYRADKTWRALGKSTPVTTIVAVDNHLDSQRRRLAGRGI